MVQHQRHVLRLQVLPQRLEGGRIPFGRQWLLDRIQVQPVDQIPQPLRQAHHRQVVDFGQPRLAAGRKLQQLALEPCQVALDLCLVVRRQALQVIGHHVGHAPEVGRVEPGVSTIGIVTVHRNARQCAIHRSRGIDLDNADIAASGHRVQRVVTPDRTHPDHRICLLGGLVQACATTPAEIRRLAAGRQVGRCCLLKPHRSAVEQGAGQAVGDGQGRQHLRGERQGRQAGQCQRQGQVFEVHAGFPCRRGTRARARAARAKQMPATRMIAAPDGTGRSKTIGSKIPSRVLMVAISTDRKKKPLSD